MNRGLWSVIAFLSCTVAIVSGVMTMLAAGVGVQVYIPDIGFGSNTIKVNLIELGWYAAFVYAIVQVVQAFTPPGKPGFERAAWAGSWIALLMFAGTLAAMVVQLGIDRGNVREIMDTSSPFRLVVLLLAFALVDVFFFPWLKRKIHGGSSADVRHDSDTRSEIVHEGPLTRYNNPLIGVVKIEHATIMNVDCRGRGVEFVPSSIEGGLPQVNFIDSAPQTAA